VVLTALSHLATWIPPALSHSTAHIPHWEEAPTCFFPGLQISKVVSRLLHLLRLSLDYLISPCTLYILFTLLSPSSSCFNIPTGLIFLAIMVSWLGPEHIQKLGSNQAVLMLIMTLGHSLKTLPLHSHPH
jgi:hypothetical protein